MIGLILQLKQEHIEIWRMFEDIRREFSDQLIEVDDLKNDLRGLKGILVAHLDLEDKMLYPVFSRSDDEETRELGNLFSEEMLGMSMVTMDFFERYMNEDVKDLFENSKFKNEFNVIAQIITRRIKIEEKILYPVYEKYYEVKK